MKDSGEGLRFMSQATSRFAVLMFSAGKRSEQTVTNKKVGYKDNV